MRNRLSNRLSGRRPGAGRDDISDLLKTNGSRTGQPIRIAANCTRGRQRLPLASLWSQSSLNQEESIYATMGLRVFVSTREDWMAIYILLSNLTDEGAKTITNKPDRLKEVNKEIEKLGVRVLSQYATLGRYDFVNIVEAADNATIARVSAELASRGSINIMTLPAINIDDFIASLNR